MPAPRQITAAALRERLAAAPGAISRLEAHSLGWICAAMTLGILLFGLWPLRFSAPNNAGWLAGTNGLRFPGGEAQSAFDPGGVVHSAHPFEASPMLAAGAFSIEILLRPAEEPAGAQGRIFTLADAVGGEPFFLGQWSTQLLVMVRQPGKAGADAFREYDAREAFKARQTRLVTLTTDGSDCTIHLDGRLAKRIADVSLLGTNASLAGRRIFLGNSPDGLHPWTGDVLGFALHTGTLSAAEVQASAQSWLHPARRKWPEPNRAVVRYEFQERAGRLTTNSLGPDNPLLIPALLRQRKPLLSLDGFTRLDPGDLALNVFGFVPYGLAVALWWIRLRPSARWVAPIIGLFAGMLVSLGIEWLQVWLPMRDSSVMDVVTNALGALLGGLVAWWFEKNGASSGGATA